MHIVPLAVTVTHYIRYELPLHDFKGILGYLL